MRKIIAMSIVSIPLVIGSISYAQEEATTIDEIVVTAQKREQNIQDVAASVSALTGQDLRDRGLDNIQSLSNFVPGMVFSGTAFVGERSGPDITIRGVANSRLFDLETSIATATTGFIYGQTPAYSFDPRLMDVDRVEVLKGPQGTLYGAASMGGTVKVMPNRPDAGGFSGKLTGGLGVTKQGDGNYEVSGVANIPLIEDVLAIRMSGFSFLDSGFIDAKMVVGDPNELRGGNSVVTDFDPGVSEIFNVDEPTQNYIENINEVTTTGGQVAIRYTPNEKLDLTLSTFLQSKDEKSLPNYEPSLSNKFNERTTELYILQPTSVDYVISQLELKYDFGFADLYSVTGAQNREMTQATDFSAITYGALGGDGTVRVPGTAPVNAMSDVDIYSQELRLEGDAEILAGFTWSIGYFYQREERLAAGSVPVSASWLQNGVADGILPPSGTRLVWAGEYNSEYTNSSYFFDLSLALTDRIIVSAGARRSNQELSSLRHDFGNVFSAGSTPTSVTTVTQHIEEDQTTPRFTASYNATDKVMLYASAAEGFRIGGANIAVNLGTVGCQNALAILGVTDPGAFESDSVWNYELGFKSAFAGDRAVLNVSVFQVDWTDLQVATSLSAIDPTCGASLTANAGAAEIRGVEVEFKALLSDNLQIGLVAEVNDAELTQGNPGLPNAQPGDPLKNIPDLAISVGLQYEFTAFAGTEAFARLDYVYTDDRSFADIASGPSEAFTLPSYSLLNLRVGAEYESWGLLAYINNLTDEVPHLGTTTLPGGPGIYADGSGAQRFVVTGRPRTAGVRITRSFW